MTSSLRIEALNKDNYDTWKIQMEALLVRNDRWTYVIDTQIEHPIVELKELEKWKKSDDKAKSDIILSISPSELKQVKGCKTSREVWLKLESTYQSKGPARKATLLKQLTLQRIEEGSDIREHTSKFFDIVDKLNEMEVAINPDLLAIMLLYSLPSSFENFRCAIESRDELPAPDVLRIKIIEESDARKSDTNSPAQNVMFVNRKPKQWRQYNKMAKKPTKNTTKDDTESFKFRCHKCRKNGHKAADCRSKDNKAYANCSQETFVIQEAYQTRLHDQKYAWCLDSGATSHLCNELKNFDRISDSKCENLNLANNSSTEIIAKGDIKLNAKLSGESKIIKLCDTLYVPDLRTNLMSVGKITKNGYEVLFKKNNALVFGPDNEIKLIADRVGDLYYARVQGSVENSARKIVQNVVENQEESNLAYKTSSEIALSWHRRLGHLNFKDLLEGARKGTMKGLNINFSLNNVDMQCDICSKGKMIRNSFPKMSERKTNLLEIIHTDVCGPFRVESLGKSKYYIEFIDDNSRWCEVRFMKSKSEVLQKTKEYIAMVEKQTDRKIKCIQSDNGTEYTNNDFNKFLKQHGILRRLTVPYNPEQNGIAERKNRTLVSTARCLLIQSGLPPSFWAEAINTANYIRNRCPSKSLNGKTPYEMWTGKPPNVSTFKEFGCNVYCLNRDRGKGKFDQRCKEGIFIGYSEETKGYRVWLPNERKTEISRDVKFLESTGTQEIEFEDFFPEEEPAEIIPKSSNNHNVLVEIEEIDSESAAENGNEREYGIQEENEVKRGRGRPTFVKTGFRGRPKKKYQEIPNMPNINAESHEEVNISEVTMKQAIYGPDATEWYQAMVSEIISIIKNETWILVDRPNKENVIGSRIVLRNKFNADGTLERRKARLVAQGFSQEPGIHFQQTFAPVARLSSLRLVTALAAQCKMKIHQLDVTCAYLNGELEEIIYMESPKQLPDILRIITEQDNSKIGEKARNMLQNLQHGNKVCLLKKSLYGLRQAGRSWYGKLNRTLCDLGAEPTTSDPCVYSMGEGEDLLIILIYVDDILIASKSDKMIKELKENLSRKFELKDIGNVNYCLGIEFSQDENGVSLNQRGYITDLLNRFGMMDSKIISTPMDSNVKMINPTEPATDEEEKLPYRELVGALTYLAVATRPDISYAVSCLGQFNNCYRKIHWTAAKRVLRYLKESINLGITYRTDNQELKGYVDADWGNCQNDRRSYTGYAFLLSGGPVSWESKKQRTVALSSTEAEFMGMTEIAKETIYLRKFMSELGFADACDEVQIFTDSMSGLKLAENPTFHNRSKHIDIRYHFIREVLNCRLMKLNHVSSENMVSDVLTKALPRQKHHRCVEMLGLNFK